jgi:hypothetical protein
MTLTTVGMRAWTTRPLVAVSLPRDWQRVLFGDLEQKIAPRRQP